MIGSLILGAEELLQKSLNEYDKDGKEYMNFPIFNRSPNTPEYMNVSAVNKDLQPKT